MSDLDARMSVSATTRASRPEEVHGKHYLFLSKEEFHRLEESGGLLESAEIFGERYGTPKAAVEEELRQGRVVLLDIDVQGARQLRVGKTDGLYIFILPPSLQVLEERLRGRKTEGAEALQRRLHGARQEMAAQGEYDLRFVNDDVDQVTARVREAILSVKESG